MAAKKNQPGKVKRPAAAAKGGVKNAKAKAASKEAQGGQQASWWAASAQFMREVKTELKKVTWPSRKQTISSTTVVLVLVGIVSIFLWLVDSLLASLVRMSIS